MITLASKYAEDIELNLSAQGPALDVRICRLKPVPALNLLNIGMQMKQKELTKTFTCMMISN